MMTSPHAGSTSGSSRPNSSGSSSGAGESAHKLLRRFKEPTNRLCIGKGSGGEVYQALDLETGALCAIKKLRIDQRLKRDAVERIVNEITLMKTHSHSHIIQYLGAGRVNGDELWIVMELASGGSLARLVERYGPLPEPLVRKYIRDCLIGLHYLHNRGIAHRDIKPENLLLGETGTTKLADFGTAKQISEEGDGMTGTVTGTPLFLAPEVALASMVAKGSPAPKYDPFRADVWSLGISICDMLEGQPPFKQMEWLQLCQKPDAEVKLPAGVSGECTQFLKACLARDPKQRPTVDELLRMPWLPSSEAAAVGGSGALASPNCPAPPGPSMSKALENTRWNR